MLLRKHQRPLLHLLYALGGGGVSRRGRGQGESRGRDRGRREGRDRRGVAETVLIGSRLDLSLK